jgi:uncharacterized protein (DUF2062 family)
MRKQLRKYLPDYQAVRDNRWLAPFATTLLHPRLWHLNRHSAAGAVAVGLFCGLIPGPLQMLGAALCAVAFRINLPLAMLTTLYTNPVTIVPLYLVAFSLGQFSLSLLGDSPGDRFVPPPDYETSLLAWTKALLEWMIHLGKPLAIGLVLLASLLAFAGYLVVRLGWRIYLIRAYRQRRRSRT